MRRLEEEEYGGLLLRTKLGLRGDLKELEIMFFGVLPIKALPSLALMYRRAFSSNKGLGTGGEGWRYWRDVGRGFYSFKGC